MNLLKICNKIIEYSFYSLFLFVPLAFTSTTSELFELNKMWLTWGLTIIIVTAWLIKMVRQRRILFRRTPLDIPIALFLASQIISTIFSLDIHVSLWGYYSRFNGGLLSIISYILLYYAFLSNLGSLNYLKRLLSLSLISGLIVALWGLPSHFGYDPTCLLFRGTLDVGCWTADFMPKIRIFSTLGQPDWLAAYLAILIPIAIAFLLKNPKSDPSASLRARIRNPKQSQNSNFQIVKTFLNFGNWNLFRISIFVLLILFYIDLLFTRARSGVLGVWLSCIFFAAVYFWFGGRPKLFSSAERLKSFRPTSPAILFRFISAWLNGVAGGRALLILFFGLLIITFVIGTPFGQLQKLTLPGIGAYFQKEETPKVPKNQAEPGQPANKTNVRVGGTESASIRRFVWIGAINAWRANPLFGTGVETFAFAYYKYKPAGQNLTSEWNFLYNKAHNEYLNYLATTGIVGLGTYLLMIGSFIFLCFKNLNPKSDPSASLGARIRNPKQYRNSNDKNTKLFENSNLFRASHFEFRILTLALIASYLSILITNFFGFSVVITNIYLFMIPAFIFILGETIKTEANEQQKVGEISPTGLTGIFFIFVISCFLLITLFRFWQADRAFALGSNLDRAGEYQKAYPSLHKAVELRGDEPVFKDELSINDAIIATGLVSQKPPAAGTASDDTQQNSNIQKETISAASALAQEAINTSNEIVSQYPNNAVFWKTRVRLFHTLSQVDSRYLSRALDAIVKASLLAPQDANIWYNLGVLYGQNNNISKGIEALEKTTMLKPDYRDAHYALGLFYHTAALDEKGKVVINPALQKKAILEMRYILDHIAPQDPDAKNILGSWKQ